MSDTEPPAPPRRGVWLYPGVPANELVEAVVVAEEVGLDEVWVADEGVARDPMVVLAAAARETSRIRLAVGITSPLLRHPGALAATAATVDELSAGRALLGLGVGGHEALGPLAIEAGRPVALVDRAIATARDVLARRASERYEPPGHAIGPRPVPIWVGARGPRLIELAARVADGVFCSGCTSTEHDRIAGQLDLAAAARDDGGARLAIYRSVAEQPGERVDAWDAVATPLTDELSRLAPAAIGLNLVELAAPESPHAPDLVRRAAAVLDHLVGQHSRTTS